jgi:hypothetical protein
VDFRSRAYTAKGFDFVHLISLEHTRELGGYIRNPKHMIEFDVLIKGTNEENLKQQKTIGEGGQELEKKDQLTM